MGGRGGIILGLAVAMLLAFAAPALADFPYAPKLAPGQAPSDFNEQSDWEYAATPETGTLSDASVNFKQSELCGIRGGSIVDTQTTQPTGCDAGQPVHTAWQVTTGRPDVTIAVLDSGIKWNDQAAMTDLRAKVRINRGELPVPRHDLTTPLAAGQDCSKFTNDYDANGDGVFNVLDYACDSRVRDRGVNNPLRHGPSGFLTPEDLILAFSDGSDADHNGYADDIAGWDFVDNKNDPFDDVQYGHGTGEARDSNAEANNGGDLGTCPNCTVVPLRVGESFVADANRFAQAVLYATDNGMSIVQEALGTINAPRFARQAIDYAYDHGVTVIASAADEAAEHHNQPGAMPHTIVVNSVTKYDDTFTNAPRSYLQFNGCTNFTTRLDVAVASTSCSSDATGKSAGVAGLIYSAALNAHDNHTLGASSDCTRVDGSPCVITPNEVKQFMTMTADDVNFAQQPEPSCNPPTPDCTDPNRNTVFSAEQNGGLVGPLASTRYHARKGFDEFYGYGRLNAYSATQAAADAKIPPEADITSPDWFQMMDPGSPVDVRGYVNARSSYTCRVEVAPGGQPNNTADFHDVPSSWCDGSTSHSTPFRGLLGTIDPGTLNFPPGTDKTTGRPSNMPDAFTVRVRVSTTGMTGEDRRQLFLHRDPDLRAHFPIEMQSDGDSSPLLVDLNGDNRNELVVANSDGVIHAYRPDGSELPGWPVRTDNLPLHTGARAYGAVGKTHGNAVLGALAAGDLFHDGRIEIVADDNGGNVYAWDQSGHRVFHRTSNPNWSGAPLTRFHTVRQGPRDRTEHGFLASPVLADLDGHGLDIIAAGEDRHLYAWHADGTPVKGFPVLVVDPDKVASVDPKTHHVTFNQNASQNPGIDEDQGKIIDTPAVAYLDGPSKPPSILLGTNEEYAVNQGDEGGINAGGLTAASLGVLGQTGVLSFANGRVYAIGNDGRFRPGWPVKVGIIDRGLLPDVGEGVNGSPVVANLNCPSGGSGPKVGVTPDAGPAYIFNADGTSCYGKTGGNDNPLELDFSAGAGQTDHPAFAAVGYPAFGNLDGTGPQFLAPVAGIMRALDIVAPEYQGGQDFIAAWDTTSAQYRPGFPSPVNDLQFLTGPAVGDVLGTPGQEQALGGTASLDLAAINAAGTPAGSSWPKLTGGWTVATPTLGSFGTLDTDASAHKAVVSLTREGTIAVYDTPAPACSPSSSPRFHHDIANSGEFGRDAVPPGAPFDASAAAGKITFKAPGDDLLCGQAKGYQLVSSKTGISNTQLNAAPVTPVAWDPGSTHTIDVSGKYVAIRFVDEAGNVGRPLRMTTR